MSKDLDASQATGLGSAEAPEPCGLGPTGAIPSASESHEDARKRSKHQFFIVFSPEGEAAPSVVHPTHKSALYAAWQMAARHPESKFFVMGSMSRPCTADMERGVRAASAGEAGTATTPQSGVVHEHAVPQGDAQ